MTKPTNSLSSESSSSSLSECSKTTPFPRKLYDMLEDATSSGFDDIVSWTQEGIGFQIHQPTKFVNDILPKYFTSKIKYKSFQRQLNMYEFQMIRKAGKETGLPASYKGTFFHPYFTRGDRESAESILRKTALKGHSSLLVLQDHEPMTTTTNKKDSVNALFLKLLAKRTTAVSTTKKTKSQALVPSSSSFTCSSSRCGSSPSSYPMMINEASSFNSVLHKFFVANQQRKNIATVSNPFDMRDGTNHMMVNFGGQQQKRQQDPCHYHMAEPIAFDTPIMTPLLQASSSPSSMMMMTDPFLTTATTRAPCPAVANTTTQYSHPAARRVTVTNDWFEEHSQSLLDYAMDVTASTCAGTCTAFDRSRQDVPTLVPSPSGSSLSSSLSALSSPIPVSIDLSSSSETTNYESFHITATVFDDDDDTTPTALSDDHQEVVGLDVVDAIISTFGLSSDGRKESDHHLDYNDSTTAKATYSPPPRQRGARAA